MTRVRQRRPARLSAESLEAREVPAAYGPLQIDPTHYASDHILVKLNSPTALRSRLASGAEDMGGGLYCIDLKPGVSVARALRHFRALRGVAFAEPDYAVHADVIPNDPSFGSLYALNNTGQSGGTPDADIDAPEAWDVNTGSGNMVVAIIDTGVDYNHPDLAANIWTNPGEIPGNGIDDEGDGFIDDVHGYDFVNNDGNPMDDNGHGSHVAGTIGAVGNNGIGVTGVNWDVQIMALKFLGANGSGTLSGAINSLNFAVAHGAKISNNSWSGGGFSSALNTAINNARAAGHLFIAAAGNNGSNNDSLSSYPSNYPQDNVLAVAATDRNDNLASFSNFGATTVDLAAPGVSILSTYRNGQYATLSGTSMATPHVTGAAALVWDAHPTWTYLQVIEALKSTVDVKPNLVGRMVTGGRLNVNAAIHFGTAPPVDTTGPRVTASAFTASGGTISSVRLTFSEAINATSFDATDVSFTGPGGAVGVSNVIPVSATQFDVTFSGATPAGAYTLVVGPNVTDAAGNAMDQNGNSINGESGDAYTTAFTNSVAQTFNSADVNKTIADVARTTSVLTINQDVSIADLDVTINLNHTWDSDLRITLVAPDGTQVVLVNRRGGSGDNFTNTRFSDEAATSIAGGVAPFSGTFRPEGSLTAFDGKNARGTWQLVIDDLAFLDSGRLNAWSVTIRS